MPGGLAVAGGRFEESHFVTGGEKKKLSIVTRVVLLTALYFLGGLLGKETTFISHSVSLVWPPSGIALAAILLFGYRFWPGIALGAVLFSFIDGSPSVLFTFFTAVGNTIGAVICAYLLERFVKFDNAMERTRDGAGFLLLACGLGTTVNAMFNVVSLIYEKHLESDQVFPSLVAWWVPNALAAVVITPFIITWGAGAPARLNYWRAAEALVCFLGLIGGTMISFESWYVYTIQQYPLAYLPYPFLAWGALRFGPRGAATGTLLVTALAIYSLLQKRGPFVTGVEADSLRLLGCYVGIIAVSNLLLATASSECQRAMDSVVANERRLRTVVADQTDLICRFRPDGTITFANPAYCEFAGKTEAELLGSNFYKLLTKGVSRADGELPLPPEQPVVTFDRRIEAADGHEEWQQCNLRRLERRGNESEEYQAVLQDITARKRAELAAKEAKVTQELMNQQLKSAASEARAMAAEANRANNAKSEFLANMSHEIRTPLSGILGMIELLAQTRLEPRQREFAQAAVDSANALLHVINDVLDFSKIEAGKMTVSREDFSVRAVVESVLENAATRVAGKKVALAAVVGRSIPQRLTGDPARLRQVLLNLVGNGVKFTEHGEVVVRVMIQQQSPEKILLRFEVTDTGIGIKPDEIKLLFQPFVQADTSSSRKFGGTGLGLAISRKLAELMGGKIGVQSTPGAGSTFWFELPFGVPPQPPSEHCYPGLVFLQVLVGVLNPSQRQSLVEQLQGWGVVCRAVPDAKELARALRLDFRTAIIPLLICDDAMLAQGGEELGRLLAENKERVQCIMLASPAGSLGADSAGAGTRATVLLKPVREQPLFDALVGVVAGEPPARNRPPTAADATLVPEAVATPPASVAPAATVPATDRPTTPLSCLRLLVAEDHPFNRKLCQLILDSFGVRAEWAVNGREAVEKFSPGRCDAILMDCNMPELDGFGATAAIRKLEAEQKVAHRVRIIALTANALVGERERCLAAGMDDYISKPFTTQQLYQALAAAVPAAVTLPATAAPTTEPASVAAPPTSGAAAASVIEPFNPARLEQLCSELDRDSVAEMVNDFLAEFPDRLADIHRLHETSQWPELERAAHSLKGLAALFGFEQLAARFLAIEDSAEVADAPKVKESVAVLDPAAQAAAQQLRDWLREVRNRPR